MTNDLVSDMLTRIRNASLAKHKTTLVKYSKLNIAILNVLRSECYIKDFSIETINNINWIKINLNYKGWWLKKPLFSTLKRVSKPGQRIFSGYKKFHNILDVLKYHQGIAIISQPNYGHTPIIAWKLESLVTTVFFNIYLVI